MDYHEKPLGKNVRFLLPSLKLKKQIGDDSTVEHGVHVFLLERFGGYTATSATVFGYWKDEDGENSYGEHREFTVALPDDRCLGELKEFLARTAREMQEQCLYVEVAGVATLLYGEPGTRAEMNPAGAPR